MLSLFEPAEREGDGARQTEKQKWRELTHKCQPTVGVLYVIDEQLGDGHVNIVIL